MELNGKNNECSFIRKTVNQRTIVLMVPWRQKMAKIIQFPVDRVTSVKNDVKTLAGATAEIIIFPGIRFEHHGVSFAIAK